MPLIQEGFIVVSKSHQIINESIAMKAIKRSLLAKSFPPQTRDQIIDFVNKTRGKGCHW